MQPKVYEKNIECTLPKDIVKGVYRPHTTFCC